MKKLFFCIVLLIGQRSVGMLSEAERQRLTAAQQAEYELIMQDSSGGSDEEVMETTTVYYDPAAEAAQAAQVVKIARGGDSSDGSSDNEPEVVPQEAEAVKGRSSSSGSTDKGKLTLTRKAAAVLGEQSVERLYNDNSRSSAGSKSPRGSAKTQNRGSGLEESTDSKRKSPRSFTIGRKAGSKADSLIEDSDDMGEKSPRVKLKKKERAVKKEEFVTLIGFATQSQKLLDKELFTKLLEKAQENECLILLADWCEKNPDRVCSSSYSDLVCALIDYMQSGDLEDLTDDEEPQPEENKKKNLSTRIFEGLGKRVAKPWHKVKKYLKKALSAVDAYGKKLEREVRALVPDIDVDGADEHLCTAVSYAVAAEKNEFETDICSDLRLAADSRDASLRDDLLEKVYEVLILAEQKLSNEELVHLMTVKEAYKGRYPDRALFAALARHYAGQVEDEIFDKLISLIKKFDLETPNRPLNDQDCQSDLIQWVKDNKSRLSRLSFGLVTDLVLNQGIKKEMKTQGKRGAGLRLYDSWMGTRKVSRKIGRVNLEAFDSFFGGDATTALFSTREARGHTDEKSVRVSRLYSAEELAKLELANQDAPLVHERIKSKFVQAKRESMMVGSPLSTEQRGQMVPEYTPEMRSQLNQAGQVETTENRLAAKAEALRKQAPPVQSASARVGRRDRDEEVKVGRVEPTESRGEALRKKAPAGDEVKPVYTPEMRDNLNQAGQVETTENRLAAKAEALRKQAPAVQSVSVRTVRRDEEVKAGRVEPTESRGEVLRKQPSSVPLAPVRTAKRIEPVQSASAWAARRDVEEEEKPVYTPEMRSQLNQAGQVETTENRLAAKAELQRKQAAKATRTKSPRDEQLKKEKAEERAKLAAIEAEEDDSAERAMKKLDVISKEEDIDLSKLKTQSAKGALSRVRGKFNKEDASVHYGFSDSSSDEVRDERPVVDTSCFICEEALDESAIRVNQHSQCTHQIHAACVNKIAAHLHAHYCGICGTRINPTIAYRKLYKEQETKQHEALQPKSDQSPIAPFAEYDEQDELYVFDASTEPALDPAVLADLLEDTQDSLKVDGLELDEALEDLQRVRTLAPSVAASKLSRTGQRVNVRVASGSDEDSFDGALEALKNASLPSTPKAGSSSPESEGNISSSESKRSPRLEASKPLPTLPARDNRTASGRGAPALGMRTGSQPGTPVKGSPVTGRTRTAPTPPLKNDNAVSGRGAPALGIRTGSQPGTPVKGSPVTGRVKPAPLMKMSPAKAAPKPPAREKIEAEYSDLDGLLDSLNELTSDDGAVQDTTSRETRAPEEEAPKSPRAKKNQGGNKFVDREKK